MPTVYVLGAIAISRYLEGFAPRWSEQTLILKKKRHQHRHILDPVEAYLSTYGEKKLRDTARRPTRRDPLLCTRGVPFLWRTMNDSARSSRTRRDTPLTHKKLSFNWQ